MTYFISPNQNLSVERWSYLLSLRHALQRAMNQNALTALDQERLQDLATLLNEAASPASRLPRACPDVALLNQGTIASCLLMDIDIVDLIKQIEEFKPRPQKTVSKLVGTITDFLKGPRNNYIAPNEFALLDKILEKILASAQPTPF
jgi:hypothetical protein